MSATEFAAAQARIAARRAAVLETDQTRTASLTHDTSLDRLPPGLRTLARSSASFWSTLQSRTGTRPAFRVGQVDAELLDEELLSLLRGQVADAFKHIGNHVCDDWSAEITVALRAVLWKLTVWDRGVRYGASLQGLKYVDARAERRLRSGLGVGAGGSTDPTGWQKAGHGMLTVLGSYGWQKWEDWLLERDDKDRSQSSPLVQRLGALNRWLGTTHEVASLMSFLVFLYNGRYRTLTDRLLRLRLAPAQSHTGHQISFEYLNRQLVWHAFTEFLLFVLPLVGVSRWKRILSRAWKHIRRSWRRRTREEDDDDEVASHGELSFLPERICAICYKDQNTAVPGSAGAEAHAASIMAGGGDGGVTGNAQTDITNPYEAISCGCVYCFVCLAHQIEASEGHGWTCLRCGDSIKECKPWNGDIVEEVTESDTDDLIDTKRMSRKSVVFAEDDYEDELHEKEPGRSHKRLSAIDPIPLDDHVNGDAEQFYDVQGSETSDAEVDEESEADLEGDGTSAVSGDDDDDDDDADEEDD